MSWYHDPCSALYPTVRPEFLKNSRSNRKTVDIFKKGKGQMKIFISLIDRGCLDDSTIDNNWRFGGLTYKFMKNKFSNFILIPKDTSKSDECSRAMSSCKGERFTSKRAIMNRFL